MRKLMMKMSVSADGFVCDTNGRKDWVFKTGDEESKAYSAALNSEPGLIILGRKSFEEMATYWPTATGPFAAPMNEIPKALFTKKGFNANNTEQATATARNTLTYNSARGILSGADASAAEKSWGEARVFDGDIAEGIKELKAVPGKPILALGGAGFMQSLIATGLIDEYHLFIHPVALGSGLAIFSGLASQLYLKLVDVKAFPRGMVAHTYRPYGEDKE